MKNLVTLILFFFISNFGFAQDATECDKIVLQTYEAINNRNADPIINYLSDDFSIAGQTGEIAKMVLPQLFNQLNLKVNNIKKISETKSDLLALVYEADFGDEGRKTSTFVFNNKNQLKSLELLPMQVMAKEGDTKVEKSEQAYFTVPFKRVGKLISVQVKLNGIERTFLVDSGSPILVLNSHHIENASQDNRLSLSNAKGIGGSISNTGIERIESLEFGGISLDSQKVITMDLSHLEKETKTTFYGLIGYEIFKDYDLLFDYKKNTITFIKPENTVEFLKNNFKSKKKSEAPLEMGGHIAIVDGYISGKKYSLGIDCGAETSLFDFKLKEELVKNLSKLKTDSLSGADKNIKEALSGQLNSLVIGGVNFKKTEVFLSEMSDLNEGYNLKLDGLIGYDILSAQPTIISYVNKKIIFIR